MYILKYVYFYIIQSLNFNEILKKYEVSDNYRTLTLCTNIILHVIHFYIYIYKICINKMFNNSKRYIQILQTT